MTDKQLKFLKQVAKFKPNLRGIIPESQTKAAVRKVLAGFGLKDNYFMPAASMYSKAGVGDFVINAFGLYLEVETKASDGMSTALQLRHANDIKRRGGWYIVVKPTIEDIEYLMKVIIGSYERAKQNRWVRILDAMER